MDRPRISVVAPVFNEEETLLEFYRRVREVMDNLGEAWELVLVDDRSATTVFGFAGKSTRGTARAGGTVRPQLRPPDRHHRRDGLRLRATPSSPLTPTCRARRRSSPNWWPAGGRDTRRLRRPYGAGGETWFKLFTARLFYRLIAALTDIRIPMEAGDFRPAGPGRWWRTCVGCGSTGASSGG